jgi:hypothetical protein
MSSGARPLCPERSEGKALFDPSLRGGRRPCSTRHCEEAEGLVRPVIARRPKADEAISFFKLTGYHLAKSSLADIAEGLGSPKDAILEPDLSYGNKAIQQ